MPTAADASALTADGTAAYKQQVNAAAAALPDLDASPAVAIMRDAELDDVLQAGTVEHTIPYANLPHYPASDGTLTIGTLGGTQVVELDQVFHLYDGHTPREVSFPVRMLATAGIDSLLLAAPAGSVTAQADRGDLMLLTDHINFQGQNPLVGPNVEEWGPRFPDMTAPYDATLRQRASDAARSAGVPLRQGIYMGLLGPHHETTAEHRMAHRLGADVVGTGVVPEVLTARHMGVHVMALTLLTAQHLAEDDGAPSSEGPSLQTGRSQLHRLLVATVAANEQSGSQ
ncbi:purine-nucleoside phosphorylase [Salinibacter ruber]|uniref:purine-nucleoside phosphorylase n=1 Tax=Salinibacter ruber TaxID=146919 RepID=A0A9X2Q7H4_9BACT|nr:purine-nucleoside phosphorylase [Salinibacter ruber]MCS3661072.1 purine-nucleoside phosphorylase [Salinibacter ruber]MCS3710871.1 purine-nucleoside phosphorylase [Salinibacter ruber]